MSASLLYELLSLVAIIFVCTALFLMLAGDATHGAKRVLLQFFLWLAAGVYYVRCWSRSGQTLAMQAWKLKVVDSDNQTISLPQACLRYVLASLSLVVFGVGYFWAIMDKQNLYLHDRLLKLRILHIS